VELTKKQAEFWVAILVLCIIFAVAILLVDFGIKAAILEESNRLRLQIEDWEVRQSGRVAAAANAGRTGNDDSDNPPFPSDVLVDNATGMEKGSSPNGDTAPRANPRKRRAQPSRQASPRTIQDGDK
jgi:hypothetical protein